MHPELLVRKRMLAVACMLGALFLLVTLRVGQLTIVESDALLQRGVSQWTKEGVVTARRGDIVDCRNNVLVMSATSYVVSADPRLVPDVDAFLDALEGVLSLNRESARKKLADKTRSSVILKRQVIRETVDRLRQLKAQAPASQGLAAITFDEDTSRWYPYGDTLSQVLGLTNVDSVGQSGLEQQFESVLKGQEGSFLHQVDARNRVVSGTESWYIPSQPGLTLKLTCDATIQQICEKAMRECMEVNEAESVLCIVSDVRTGGILAMCMKPDYNPNEPPRSDAARLAELMRITAISDVYEPGSTFKILTAAAALDAGVTSPTDQFYCSAKVKVDGDTIRCWGRPHGVETMAEGLQNSCNPVFVELALRMGKDTFYRYLTAFGLGKATGIELPGESGGILIAPRYVRNVDLARIGFGQSVAVTPLQLVMAANAAINGGKLMKPRLVEEIRDRDGNVLERFAPSAVSTPVTPETSAVMRTLLLDVVEKGGGKNARVSGYLVGGKTGTAQVYKDGRITRDVHIGSFYGFAPVDDPLFSVLVVVKEAKVPVDYGSATAAPFAGKVIGEVLQYMQIEPENEKTLPECTVPAVMGLTISAARRKLADAGLEIMTDGVNNVALSQMPPAGANLRQGGHVMVYTVEDESATPKELVCVPDFSGMNGLDCARLAHQRGLEIDLTGAGLCISQNPAVMEYVSPGSTVRITLAQP